MINLIADGRLVRDAETTTLRNGSTMVRFTIATDYAFGKRAEDLKAEGKPVTLFIDCVGFGQKYENMLSLLKQGNQVFVSGEFSLNNWYDDNNTLRTNYNLNLYNVSMGAMKRTNSGNQGNYNNSRGNYNNRVNNRQQNDDELPFE